MHGVHLLDRTPGSKLGMEHLDIEEVRLLKMFSNIANPRQQHVLVHFMMNDDSFNFSSPDDEASFLRLLSPPGSRAPTALQEHLTVPPGRLAGGHRPRVRCHEGLIEAPVQVSRHFNPQ